MQNNTERNRLKNKIVVLSGGSGGMALSHARMLVNEGARVIAFDIKEDNAPVLVAELGEENFYFMLGNVTFSDDWDNVVKKCREIYGTPNVLVNNAGISPLHSLAEVTESDYRRVIDINQVGTFLGMKALLPSLRENGGSIINISSTAGCVGMRDLTAYCASKWAIRGMTKTAALELAPEGIRANTICPGDTDTPMIRAFDNVDTGAMPDLDDLPMGRWGQPEEISSAVVFLASDESSYISGADIVIDGAFTAE